MELMALRRRVISQRSQGGAGSDAYNLILAYLQIDSNKHYVGATSNSSRIVLYGGAQAGQYATRNDDTSEYRLPVCKLPSGTVSITISFTDVTRLYSGYLNVYWMKDIYAGSELPSYVAYYASAW